jgi:spermidine synthase
MLGIRKTLTISFFLSGMSSLIYEVVWSRMLQIFFSTTISTTSAIFAIFLLGFGAGAYLWRNRSAKNGLKSLRNIQFLLGAYGIGIIFLIPLTSSLYTLLPDSFLIRFGLSMILVLPPALLLGATWPLVNRIYVQHDHTKKHTKDIGNLYFLNSLGAALGAFISGFVLIPLIGLSESSFFAACLNLTSAVLLSI